MSADGSVSYWLSQLKTGDQEAAEKLWHRYFRDLMNLARHKLQSAPRRVADEEDVALSAFASLCRGIADARFPRLDDRHDLWQILVVLTSRKACNLIQRERGQKRDSRRTEQGPAAEVSFAELISREPDPALASQLADTFDHLMNALDKDLRDLAQLKLNGDSHEDIAAKLHCSLRTVGRKLELIRTIWTQELES